MLITIIGIIVVLGSVVGGYLLEKGHLLVLNQPAEFLIIGGAAAGSLLISTPFRVLTKMVDQMKQAVRPTNKQDYLELLSMLFQLFRVIQQAGLMALESHFDDPSKSSVLSKFPGFLARDRAVDFLSDSVKVINMGTVPPHDIEALMDEDLQVHHDEACKPVVALSRIADALPGLGIVAAVLGVVITMGAIDGPPSEIGHKVGAALVGTFLGIFLSYGFVQPMASKLEYTVDEEARYLLCIKTALLASLKGSPPGIAIEFARRILPGHARPTFDETEAFCRGRAPAAPVAA